MPDGTTEEEKPGFWTAVAEAVNPSAYRPSRNGDFVAARLERAGEPYYVLKQPQHHTYLRLSEQDYALWWQMDGCKTIKDLLFYAFLRYSSLPIGRLNSLVNDLRQGHFLQDSSVGIYRQAQAQLAARAPAGRGRRLINAFLHSEWEVVGLENPFNQLYRWLAFLFTWPAQLFLLALILVGGGLFGRLIWVEQYSLIGGTAGPGLGLLTFLLANLLVIFIHELAHGLMTKHLGRELHRGGFLIYWGLPAFFVDTRDTWLSPRLGRIAVSWAGPHSGLIIGGITGILLTLIASLTPDSVRSLWASFIYQVGFIAYLSVFVNVNPLLELDGYFILMDWLDMPGLRQRSFLFLRRDFWKRLAANPLPWQFWPALPAAERIYTLFGALALAYSFYALLFSLYFWQSRLWPWIVRLWNEGGLPGRLLLAALAAAVVLPATYYLLLFALTRLQAALEWLARRDLLARADVLALLIGIPLFLVSLWLFIGDPPLVYVATALLYLAAAVALAVVAYTLPGSRFQWAVWSLSAAAAAVTLAALLRISPWHEIALLAANIAILTAGVIGWLTVRPSYLDGLDRGLMAFFLFSGLLTGLFAQWNNGIIAPLFTFILLATSFGLLLLTPLLLNFRRSRFALAWLLMTLSILALPWLALFPALHPAVALLWLYAGLLYLALALLAQFGRHLHPTAEAALGERERLMAGFNHFLHALFASYEAVFGGRRLAAIQAQVAALGPLHQQATMWDVAERCRTALLLVVDRLDDLAGAPYTARMGQAAYDSLPWPEAETLARHLFARLEWGKHLAEGFIQAQDLRVDLIRQADIFAGFDDDAVQRVLSVARPLAARPTTLLAQAGDEATRLLLIESGEVAVIREGEQVATLSAGGYFGEAALLETGPYSATYQALLAVTALVIHRHDFDPLLRADTALASQVHVGAAERDLLKRMPLFNALSPQQITAVDARLRPLVVPAGKVVARQGQFRSHLFIVQSGLVEAVSRNEQGEEVVVERISAGDHFGEYALFADTAYTATYRTAEDSKLLLLDEPTFDSLVTQCSQMSHYVEQIGSGRLIATRRRLGLTGVVG
jgi:putative peptide zinc metalloprotease protein